MKTSHFIFGLVALGQGINAAAIHSVEDVALDIRTPVVPIEQRDPETFSQSEDLWKRKGGGGAGGRGGSSGSSGGSSGSSGGSSSSGGRGSSTSNSGGSTTTGSGVRPSYGGGSYYGGGARQPYSSGKASPSGILPLVVGGAALGTLGFVGLSLASNAYAYPYTNRYYYHNSTTNQNETKPVTCICDYYGVCGCDDNGNQTYFNSVIGDGSYQNLNKSLVTVAENETTHEKTIYILGTLPNGTTSSGGTEDPNAGAGLQTLARAVGWWPVVTTAIAIVCLS
ncbi:hypothetical protein F4813DRAFT_361987 [Daldinia decipiens]|uniref:uncharacterized protein n=1 Tax=Daldinia decipiens TaxID=326647 RepID=UPI0020C3814E|nr:uncharacterized protein F4813DRAFT_361987 [Daldinia decipiens]KAI1656827.1 hypothetical protein F4813DRAFT_361987 [Daldinia decipiens]